MTDKEGSNGDVAGQLQSKPSAAGWLVAERLILPGSLGRVVRMTERLQIVFVVKPAMVRPGGDDVIDISGCDCNALLQTFHTERITLQVAARELPPIVVIAAAG